MLAPMLSVLVLMTLLIPQSGGQQLPSLPGPAPAPTPVRLGPNLIGLGELRINTATRELRAPGQVNAVTILEFVANTPKGLKEYESAITINSAAVSFNAGLLLLGLDPDRARVPRYHLDPTPAAGDPVEVWVEWSNVNGDRRVRIEDLLYNTVTKTTMPQGPWVYTGSAIAQGQFLAEADGVLIGFVHSPAPLIENPRDVPAKAYGEVVLNPNLGLTANMPVTVVVRALDRTARNR